jgi:hypothetical protein
MPSTVCLKPFTFCFYLKPPAVNRAPNALRPALFLTPYTLHLIPFTSSIQHPVSRLAARRRFPALNPGLDDVGCTADSRCYADGIGRAIQGTGPAFHASVKISNCNFFAFQLKNSMGADIFTHAATHTRLGF